MVAGNRILHATDYPFNGENDFAAKEFVITAPVDDPVREKIGWRNWETLHAAASR